MVGSDNGPRLVAALVASIICGCGQRVTVPAGDQGPLAADSGTDQVLCPEAARVVGSIGGIEGELSVHDQRIFLAHASQAFSILDVSDRTRPRLLGTAKLGVVNGLHGVYRWGGLAFTGNDGHGLRVIDVADESSPREVVYPGAGFQLSYVNVFAVSGRAGRVYYAEFGGRLSAVDFRDAARPTPVFNTTLPFRPRTLAASGTRLYAAGQASILNPAHSSGVSVFDIGSPDSPRLVMHREIKDASGLLAATSERVFVARAGMVAAFDSAMKTAGTLATRGSVTALAAQGRYLVLVDSARGLVVVRVEESRLQELGLVPLSNPQFLHSLALDLPFAYLTGSVGISIGNPPPPPGLRIISLKCIEG